MAPIHQPLFRYNQNFFPQRFSENCNFVRMQGRLTDWSPRRSSGPVQPSKSVSSVARSCQKGGGLKIWYRRKIGTKSNKKRVQKITSMESPGQKICNKHPNFIATKISFLLEMSHFWFVEITLKEKRSPIKTFLERICKRWAERNDGSTKKALNFLHTYQRFYQN